VTPRVMVVLLLALLRAAPARAAEPPAVEQGVRLFEQGRFDEAQKTLAPAASAKPPSATAAFYLGRIAMRTDDAKQAERWFEAAIGQDEANAAYHLWLGRAYGTQAEHAGKLSQFGLAKKVKAEFERAVALDANNLEAREGLIDYYLEAPGFMGGSPEKAKQQAGEIARRDPLRGTLASARIAEDQKDLAGAERAYQSAAHAAPDSMGPRYALGLFYARTKQFDQAFATFEDMLKAKPGELGALYQVGRTGALSGQRLDRAEAALQQFLAAPPAPSTPNPAAAHWRLGMVYDKGGKKDLARQEYQRSLALDPQQAEAKKALAALK
jgi:tetratricopeptide (TPR) repeat protein